MLKNWFAAAMQSSPKVPKLSEEVDRALSPMQVGSAASFSSFGEGLMSSVDRGATSAAKRGFAKQMFL